MALQERASQAGRGSQAAPLLAVVVDARGVGFTDTLAECLGIFFAYAVVMSGNSAHVA